MYNIIHIPAVTLDEINKAMTARFERTISYEDLFDSHHAGTFMYYSLAKDKEVGKMPPEEAIIYLFMKTIMTKDFQIYQPGVLIQIS